MNSYDQFLESKKLMTTAIGFQIPPAALNPALYPFQCDIDNWAIRRGRAAIFADCGMGKSAMQLEWGKQVHSHTGGDVLIAAPLAVAAQTKGEGQKFGIDVNLCRTQADVIAGLNITNYDMLHHFDATKFAAIILDESSILKSYSGAMRNQIIELFRDTPYRLACSATPSPNDFMELGNHAEFLGIMTRAEMLAQFFVHDGGDTSKWRLKGHAESEFWKWVTTWAVMIRKPSDLGYADEGFHLPPITYHEHIVECGEDSSALFPVHAQTLMERRQARRKSLGDRVACAAEIANSIEGPCLIWCDLNDEGDELTNLIPGAVQVAGKHSNEVKESAMMDFSKGNIRVLVTKPSIAGFGMNWQHCANVIFVGLSDSYEAFYQATRRCWRFGQKNPVHVHIVVAETEGAVLQNIKRKEADAERMAAEMVKHMQALQDVAGATARESNDYLTTTERGEGWTAHLGDCVEVMSKLEPECIDYSIFSPPFASLYTYSNSERDMGNCKSLEEFFVHFRFMVDELYRIIKPGRLVSFHCFDIPAMKERDGYIGLIDFPAMLRQAFEDNNFIYHSKVTIWKDPVTAMQRTKALGLLHKTIRKDSSMSRQGIADYLITMRKPGVNPEPIAHTHESFPVSLWQRYASPVWMDINPSKTLQREAARAEKDERHICPLQIEVVERAIELWSNPGDRIWTPYLGIGTEAVTAVEMGRVGEGAELKQSYFEQAVKNLKAAVERGKQVSLFSEMESDDEIFPSVDPVEASEDMEAIKRFVGHAATTLGNVHIRDAVPY